MVKKAKYLFGSISFLLSVFSYADSPQQIPSDMGGPRFMPWWNDYSYLKDEENRKGTWQERFNYIPIGKNPDHYLTVGGEIRYYGQYWEHVTLGVSDKDRNDSVEQRIRVYGDLHLGNNFRAFLELSDNWEFNAEFPTPANYSALDIQQFFIDYKLELSDDVSVTFRPGRFNMPLGSGILMGTRDGTNIWYTYEGLRTFLDINKSTQLELFDVKPTQYKRGSFEDEADDSRRLSGAYLTQKLPNKDKLDVYYYKMKHEKNISYPDLLGTQDRNSLGLRYYGKAEKIDYDLEGVYQFGEMAHADISAYSLMSNFGYTLDSSIKTRLGLRSIIFSGDDNTQDNKLGTFEAPFPRTALFTYSGLLGLMNIVQIEPSLTMTFNPKLNFKASYGFFNKAEAEDAIYYGGSGRPLALSKSNSKKLANIAELQINYLPIRNLNFNLTLSHIKAEEALVAVGGENTNYAGLWAQFKF